MSLPNPINVNNGNFEIEVKFLSQPSQDSDSQGLRIEEAGSDDYIKFNVSFHEGQEYIYAALVANGREYRLHLDTITPGSATHLKVIREGGEFTLQYSADGVTWTTATSLEPEFTGIDQVAVFGGNDDGGSFTPVVDYFQDNSTAPIPNEAPITNNDSASVETGDTVNINVLDNDSDINGNLDPATVTIINGPSNGTISIDANGVVTYTHDGSATTTDSFTYTVTDTEGATSTPATVNLTIAPNQAPVTVDDSANVIEGEAVTINVLGNDSDSDGTLDLSSVTVVGTPSNGTLTLNPDGTITYSHNGSATTTDSFTYTVADNKGAVSTPATVNLTIAPNQAPVTVDDSATVIEGEAVTINVLGNDSDSDGTLDLSSVTVVGTPSNGTLTVNPDGTITYSHDGSTSTTDSFTYTVADNKGAASNPATVNLTVTPPPVGTENPDPLTVNGDFDIEVKFLSQPSQDSDSQGFRIEEVGTDDYIKFNVSYYEGQEYIYAALVAGGREYRLHLDTITSGSASHLKATRTGSEINLQYSADGLTWTTATTAEPEFTGIDQVAVFGDNDNGGSFTPLVEYFQNNTTPLPNQAPTANDDNFTVEPGETKTLNVTDNDTDSDGAVDLTTLTIVTQPFNGTITPNNDGTFTYTHDGSASTSDSFTYTVQDNAGDISNTATVNLTIAANQAPTANNDSGSVSEGNSVVLNVLANDTDSDGTLNQVTIATNPSNGTVSVNPDGTITYTHDGSATTSDSFTYKVTDDDGSASNTATVNITIAPNQAPQITSNGGGATATLTTPENTTFVTNIQTSDDNDSENSGLTYTIIGGNDASQFTVNGNTGALSFINLPDYETPGDTNGDNQYDVIVQVTDSGGLSDTQQLSIQVSDVNESSTGGPTIDLWDGNVQQFGQNGKPQKWINILGEVTDNDGVSSLSYSLNGGPSLALNYEANGLRLAYDGDFNVDIAFDDLDASATDDIVTITAVDGLGNVSTETVTVDYETPPASVSVENYTIDWETVTNMQDVGQSIDGKWGLVDTDGDGDNDGLRTIETGYDRLFGFGDTSWDNYEVQVAITMDQFNPAGGSGIGLLLRWNGHTTLDSEGNESTDPDDLAQPIASFYPLGGIGWYTGSGFEIFTDGGKSDTSATLVEGNTYIFKMRVEDVEGTDQTKYSLKVWEEGTPEPVNWSVEQSSSNGPSSGGAALISHRNEVTFGDVTVTPLAGPVNQVPVANDDTVSVEPGTSEAIDVLFNDVDSDGSLNPATVTVVDAPDAGTFSVNATTGAITYTHDGSATTSDSFTYTVADDENEVSNTATVNITIAPNQAPVTNNDSATVIIGDTLNINVLSNDSDSDGTLDTSSVTVVNQPNNGTVTVESNGTITYTHDGSTTTSDSFTYTVVDNDGAASPEATVSLTIEEPPSAIRINAGGNAYTDVFGRQWSVDTGYAVNGLTYDAGLEGGADTSEAALYGTERFGTEIIYEIPVENGVYDLNLSWLENYHTLVGERMIDVFVEGQQVLDNVDALGEAGFNKLLTKEISDITVSDGELNLELFLDAASADSNAYILAIELLRDFGSTPGITATGNSGNNTVSGTANNDTLIGVNVASSNPGTGEIDTLTGLEGKDTFVLGDGTQPYYDDGLTNTDGSGDYGLITDFNITEQDIIQLFGNSTDYVLGSSPVGLESGQGIFRQEVGQPDELIGIVEGVSGLTLNSPAFSFV